MVSFSGFDFFPMAETVGWTELGHSIYVPRALFLDNEYNDLLIMKENYTIHFEYNEFNVQI
jgi:hypothetical protein